MEVETRSALSPFPYSLDQLDHSQCKGDSKSDVNIECHDFEPDDNVTNSLSEPARDVNAPVDLSCTNAAVKLQKVYRSYRTRRRLADSAVVAEELWWQAIDFARLNHSTISFFNFSKPESASLRWSRISLNASKVGKGLSRDDKALLLAFQHWIEAIDPRHRYGHSLHMYYEEWRKGNSGQPFFYWLDIGDGKEVELQDCPRSKLRQQCIKYLGPLEREQYEYVVVEGKVRHKESGNLLHTSNGKQGTKWIFVMSTNKKLYAGEKKKGKFHHSTFLAGGATLAAGRLVTEEGVLKSISPYSGHYKPSDESFSTFLSFLRERGVNLGEVEINKASEDSDIYDDGKKKGSSMIFEAISKLQPPQLQSLSNQEMFSTTEPSVVEQTAPKGAYRRQLSGGLKSPKTEVPQTAILKRINSKKAARSYQLGHQLTTKWSTGAGPRIGCVADYPTEVRLQALEFVNLSPRSLLTPSSLRRSIGVTSSPTTQSPTTTSSPTTKSPTTTVNDNENSTSSVSS